MTIFAAIRSLSYLARDVHAAAQHVLTPRLLDGADELAEHEAAQDVWEPQDDCGLVGRMDPGPGSCLVYTINADGCSDPVFRSNPYAESTPGTSTVRKVCNMCDTEITGTDYNYCADHLVTTDDVDPLDRITAILVDIRNLLRKQILGEIREQYRNAPVEDVDDSTVIGFGNREVASEPRPPRRSSQSPVASASPPTPADATGPTLGNDPYAVQKRMRRNNKGDN